MLVCRDPVGSQTSASTFVECTFIGWAGPWSWYSSWPDTAPLESDFALPPKVALSPFLAVKRPPTVTATSQSGVVGGSTHVFAAAPPGSPGS
jgi:hypothetical protein